MTPNRIWLSPPELGGEERRFVAEAFDSNWIAPVGPQLDAFEGEFAARIGTRHAVAVSSGTLTTSLVHPREVFRAAVREAAACVIVAHNHPSGDPEPSPEDLEVTRRLRAAGELLGIPLQDHVILGERSFVSLRERQNF